MEKSLRMENQKRKKVTGKKKKKEEKKKKQAQRRKKEYHSVKKGKNFLCVCRFVVLLLSPVPGFFHFCRGFPLPLATLLIIVSSSSTLFERSRYKKRCQQWVTFPGKS